MRGLKTKIPRLLLFSAALLALSLPPVKATQGERMRSTHYRLQWVVPTAGAERMTSVRYRLKGTVHFGHQPMTKSPRFRILPVNPKAPKTAVKELAKLMVLPNWGVS